MPITELGDGRKYIVGTLRSRPEFTNRFASLSSDYAKQSLAEPGCALFEILPSAQTEGSFVLVEVYVSEEAHAEHCASAHYIEFEKVISKMCSKTYFEQAWAEKIIIYDDN